MRGRKPKPTAVHERQGSYKKDPQRRRTSEPKAPAGAPTCPAHLDRIAKAEWRRITKLLDQMGILTQADAGALEQYCDAYSKWRDAVKHVKALGLLITEEHKHGSTLKRNPADIARKDNASLCLKLLTEFGLTPSSRARVNAQESKEEDPLSVYLKSRGGIGQG